MNFNEIMTILQPYFVAMAPALTALGVILGVGYKILKAFTTLRDEVKDKTDLQEARNEMKMIIHQNAKVLAKVDEVITQQSKVITNDKEV